MADLPAWSPLLAPVGAAGAAGPVGPAGALGNTGPPGPMGGAILPNAVLFGSRRVFNVTNPSYAGGAVGDGVTQDTAAAQAAHDALLAAGGGILYFPMTAGGGTYLLNGPGGVPVTANGVSWAVALSASNIQVVADPGVTYKTTLNAATFFFGGALKPAGAANWAANRISGSAGLAVKPINGPVAAGAVSVTCTTAADAGIFAAGDWIYLRTGQCVSGAFPQSNPTEPDSEINQVLSANAATGVIVLRWPLLKPLAQEYFPNAGSLGPTNTTATAWPAPFGVSKITDRMQTNLSFEGGKFLHSGDGVTGTSPIASCLEGVGGIFGLRTRFDSGSLIGGHFTTVVEARNVDYDHSAHFTSQAPSFAYHSIANADTGCSDVRIKAMASAEKGAATVELHEGAAKITVASPLLMNPVNDPTVYPSLHAAGRVYDVTMQTPTVVNGGANGGIYVDNACPGGGKILGPTLIGIFPAGTGIAVNSPNWVVRDEKIPDGAFVGAISAFLKNPQIVVQPQELVALVAFSDADVRLGELPPGCWITGARLHTLVAFNGGTNQISIGTPASHAGYAAAQDVSALYDHPPYCPRNYQNTAADVHAYFTQTGALATAGLAIVAFTFSACKLIP